MCAEEANLSSILSHCLLQSVVGSTPIHTAFTLLLLFSYKKIVVEVHLPLCADGTGTNLTPIFVLFVKYFFVLPLRDKGKSREKMKLHSWTEGFIESKALKHK